MVIRRALYDSRRVGAGPGSPTRRHRVQLGYGQATRLASNPAIHYALHSNDGLVSAAYVFFFPRALVADDQNLVADPRTSRFVCDTLSNAGYAPLVSAAPEDLSAILFAERTRLVLLDLLLPNSDGIELLERFPQLVDIPVISISSYGRDETVARVPGGGSRLQPQAVLVHGAAGARGRGLAPAEGTGAICAR